MLKCLLQKFYSGCFMDDIYFHGYFKCSAFKSPGVPGRFGKNQSNRPTMYLFGVAHI